MDEVDDIVSQNIISILLRIILKSTEFNDMMNVMTRSTTNDTQHPVTHYALVAGLGPTWATIMDFAACPQVMLRAIAPKHIVRFIALARCNDLLGNLWDSRWFQVFIRILTAVFSVAVLIAKPPILIGLATIISCATVWAFNHATIFAFSCSFQRTEVNGAFSGTEEVIASRLAIIDARSGCSTFSTAMSTAKCYHSAVMTVLGRASLVKNLFTVLTGCIHDYSQKTKPHRLMARAVVYATR